MTSSNFCPTDLVKHSGKGTLLEAGLCIPLPTKRCSEACLILSSASVGIWDVTNLKLRSFLIPLLRNDYMFLVCIRSLGLIDSWYLNSMFDLSGLIRSGPTPGSLHQ